MTHFNEQELIDAVESQRNFVRRHTYSSPDGRQLVDDIMQEIYISVWNGRNRFNPEKAPLEAWVNRIAKNKVMDFFRAQKRKKRYQYTLSPEMIVALAPTSRNTPGKTDGFSDVLQEHLKEAVDHRDYYYFMLVHAKYQSDINLCAREENITTAALSAACQNVLFIATAIHTAYEKEGEANAKQVYECIPPTPRRLTGVTKSVLFHGTRDITVLEERTTHSAATLKKAVPIAVKTVSVIKTILEENQKTKGHK